MAKFKFKMLDVIVKKNYPFPKPSNHDVAIVIGIQTFSKIIHCKKEIYNLMWLQSGSKEASEVTKTFVDNWFELYSEDKHGKV